MVQSGCLVPLNETCSPQTILILPLYVILSNVSNSVGQGPILNWYYLRAVEDCHSRFLQNKWLGVTPTFEARIVF